MRTASIRRRLLALTALAMLAVALGLALEGALTGFPRALAVLACAALAATVAWVGLRHGGTLRTVSAAGALILLAAAVAIVVLQGRPLQDALIVAALALSLAAARSAFRVHAPLPAAPAPLHPVLFYNPRSGGGKAERFQLAEEARRRGIEPVELRPGDDLEQLVLEALARGADGLAAAGGDGTQATVARLAAANDLPFACIPAGTRNHFALDLGVDRDDVVGALDAFVDGGERRVDLGEVNGRVFVNNVSLGIYAEAVHRPGYREAKIRTLLDTIPDVLGPQGRPLDLHWEGPGGQETGVALLVSNNQYRLGRAIGSGMRPLLDDGLLGVTVLGPTRSHGALGWHQWSTPELDVAAGGPVPAGIDGEATTLDPPLRFRVRPGVLRVRISPRHPGASPSALMPPSAPATLRALVRFAFGPSGTAAPAADE